MKIDALIFDIGSVVIPFDWQAAEGQFLARSSKGTKLLRDELKELIASFEVGEISQEVFVAIATRTTGFQGDGREFIAIWNSVFRPNPPLERRVRRLLVSREMRKTRSKNLSGRCQTVWSHT